MQQENKKYDLVIIDPPSFAKAQNQIDLALKQYKRLARLGLDLVNKEGLLILASCSSRIEAVIFFANIESVLNESTRRYEILEKTFHDIDHPISFSEGAYLKCGYYKIID